MCSGEGHEYACAGAPAIASGPPVVSDGHARGRDGVEDRVRYGVHDLGLLLGLLEARPLLGGLGLSGLFDAFDGGFRLRLGCCPCLSLFIQGHARCVSRRDLIFPDQMPFLATPHDSGHPTRHVGARA